MNKVGTEGNEVRQIVPAEFNFMSVADQQVVAAMEGIVKAMYGLGSNQAVVAVGMEATWSNTTTQGPAQASMLLTQRLTFGTGVVLWDGKLWEFGGGYIDGIGRFSPLQGNDWVLVMSEQVASPSPVYGATIALDVTPHKRLVCTLMSAEDASEATQKVTLGNVMRLGLIGEATSVTERSYMIREVTVETT